METLIPFLAIISFIIGASIGSFLNVVIIDCREAFQSTSQDDHFAQVVITRSHFI